MLFTLLTQENPKDSLNSFSYLLASYFLQQTAATNEEAYQLITHTKNILRNFNAPQKTSEKKEEPKLTQGGVKLLFSPPPENAKKSVEKEEEKEAPIRTYMVGPQAVKAAEFLSQICPFKLEKRTFETNDQGEKEFWKMRREGSSHCFFLMALNLLSRSDVIRPYLHLADVKEVAIIIVQDHGIQPTDLMRRLKNISETHKNLNNKFYGIYRSAQDSSKSWHFIDNPEYPFEKFIQAAKAAAKNSSPCTIS